MAGKALPTIFRQGVGRTIFILFVVAGVVPVLVTAALAIMEMQRAAESRVHETLRQNAKAYGVDILTRLLSAADKATEIASAIADGEAGTLDNRKYLFDDFEAVWLSSASGARTTLYGEPNDAVIAGLIQYDYLRAGNTQLLVVEENSNVNLILLRLVDTGRESATMVAYRLKHDHVWGPPDQVPFNTDFCVFLSNGSALFCTQYMTQAVHKELGLAAEALMVTWVGDSGENLAASWQLFLAGALQAPSLDIIASQPKRYALQSNADFRRIFVPALGLVIILTGLLSFRMIEASLGPLTRLTRAARLFADGNLSARVRIDSKNEFGALGRAFNTMAGRLGRQFDALEAMSEIDQLILTGASFDKVCEAVTQHLLRISGSGLVAIIHGLGKRKSHALMYAASKHRVFHNDIKIPSLVTDSLTKPHVEPLDMVDSRWGGNAKLFLENGQTHVAVIPVLLQNELKGILLVGSMNEVSLGPDKLQQCTEIADRFAVALSSFERERALYQKANYDDLTRLPNRTLLKERLHSLINQAAAKRQAGAMLYLDLDRFKEINDVYGHSVGDIVLVQAAERIVSEMRDDDIVARLGGDEFVVVLPNVSRNEVVKSTAVRLLSRLTDMFSVLGTNHFVGASIGIVMFPDDGDSVETLLKNADAAMYRAKEAGRARYEFFNHELNAEGRRKIELERELRGAAARGELQLYYQPQLDLDTGALCGAEALLRWRHETLGQISPDEFIPLAEESNLIVEIGQWVIDRSVRDLRQIIDSGLHPGPVSVNVSARQLRNQDLASELFSVLAKHGILPSNLRIEVTETAVAQNRDTAIELLERLRQKGIRIAIDDFGTGYSSLSYLQNMPYDVIKIDQSFVALINAGETSANICRTIIRMAHELGKTSVAEGVESQAQVDFLRESGCDVVQGFFYAKPMPFDDFVSFIRKVDLHTHRRKALELV